MSRIALVLPALVLSVAALAQQPSSAPSGQNSSSYSAIPVDAAKAENPVKPGPESLARAKKWWTLDCVMCHGKEGDGKGETARDMKLTIGDFTDPNTLKNRTDGELFYVIRKGKGEMPPEGDRAKDDDIWNMVNYIREFGKK